jgi:hypothetical protein
VSKSGKPKKPSRHSTPGHGRQQPRPFAHFETSFLFLSLVVRARVRPAS